jgi:hypothetical protein
LAKIQSERRNGYLSSCCIGRDNRGKARKETAAASSLDLYDNRVVGFNQAMEQLEQAFLAIGQVLGHNGHPLADDRGV